MEIKNLVKVFVGINKKNNYNYAAILYDKNKNNITISDIILSLNNNEKPFYVEEKYRNRLNKYIEDGKSILCHYTSSINDFYYVNKYGNYDLIDYDNNYILYTLQKSFVTIYND